MIIITIVTTTVTITILMAIKVMIMITMMIVAVMIAFNNKINYEMIIKNKNNLNWYDNSNKNDKKE